MPNNFNYQVYFTLFRIQQTKFTCHSLENFWYKMYSIFKKTFTFKALPLFQTKTELVQAIDFFHSSVFVIKPLLLIFVLWCLLYLILTLINCILFTIIACKNHSMQIHSLSLPFCNTVTI